MRNRAELLFRGVHDRPAVCTRFRTNSVHGEKRIRVLPFRELGHVRSSRNPASRWCRLPPWRRARFSSTRSARAGRTTRRALIGQEEAARPRHLERPRHRSNLNVPAPRNPGGPQIKQRLLGSFMTDVHSLCSWAGWAPVRHGPRPPFDRCVGRGAGWCGGGLRVATFSRAL